MAKFNFEIGDIVVFRTCSSARDVADSYVDKNGEKVYREIDNRENSYFINCDGIWKVGTYAAKLHNNHVVVYHDIDSETIYEIYVREDAILPFNALSKEYIVNFHNRCDEEYIIKSYKKKVKDILIQSSIDLDIDW